MTSHADPLCRTRASETFQRGHKKSRLWRSSRGEREEPEPFRVGQARPKRFFPEDRKDAAPDLRSVAGKRRERPCDLRGVARE